MFQLHAGQDPNVPPFTSRLDMAYWILRGSPKLCWLVNYVNEKKKQGKRVAVFVMWPVTQWLIEAVFELLGFDYVSIRSEKTMKLRQEAVATFCDPESRCDVSVCSFACGGFGLNFQLATAFMVHVEFPYNVSTMLQANGRLHRLGQKFEQEIFILCLDSSYDRFMLARISSKYFPEMIANLAIPDDARIGDKVRPPASAASQRSEFDSQYGQLVIADMLGLREPELVADVAHPPRKQIRDGNVAGKAFPHSLGAFG